MEIIGHTLDVPFLFVDSAKARPMLPDTMSAMVATGGGLCVFFWQSGIKEILPVHKSVGVI